MTTELMIFKPSRFWLFPQSRVKSEIQGDAIFKSWCENPENGQM